MSRVKQELAAAKVIGSLLLRIATSPLVLRTALFFLILLGGLLALVFKLGFPKSLLWQLPIPFLIFSAALAVRTLWSRMSASAEGPRVYDKAKYHYDGDFPKGLPRKQAFVHTGMFIGWLIEHGMVAKDFKDETDGFKERRITGAQVYKAWDGCLTSEALTDEGNAFAAYYYDGPDGNGGPYFEDYEAAFVGDLPSMYHVEDSWENYDTIKKKIDERYEAWKKKQRRTPREKFEPKN